MKRFCLIFFLTSAYSIVQAQMNADSLVFSNFLSYASKEKIIEKRTGERILSIATYFIETPYLASTLEEEGPERLQVNLREFDCMTFVETVLALHYVLKEHRPDYETFKRILTSIRYRNGIICGYPSRLHYTTDWLFDNKRKGFIEFVKMGCASERFKPALDFMSTHPNFYPALKNNSAFVEEMAKHENRINRLLLRYVPKEKLSIKASFIRSGDIIAITTSTKGLDFGHLGFAIRKKGELYLLHASTSGKKVLISCLSLKDYLSDIKKHTGIVVARPL